MPMVTKAYKMGRNQRGTGGVTSRFWGACTFCAVSLALGCGGANRDARSPGDTLREYARAIEEGRTKDAYAMLSDDAKRQMSEDAFSRMLEQNPQEAKEIVSTFKRDAGLPVVTATIETQGGDTLLLRYESGKWRVDASAIDVYSQATPRQAVVSFIRAFERGRFDVLMRFVPDEKKSGLDAAKLKQAWQGSQKAEMESTVEAVKIALPTANFEQVAGRATMAFGSSGTVQLVQEHGDWKIEDFAK